MARYKLTVAYEGTDFHGWQRQNPPDAPPPRTVQAVLEEAISDVVRSPVTTLGASRTDAGVHAKAQVAAFTTDTTIDGDRLAAAISSRLPEDVRVIDAVEVAHDFDPIGHCIAKGYRYTLAHGRREPQTRPLFDRRVTAWTPYVLDVEAMKVAAEDLVGEHDFASFTRVHHGRESTVRRVDSCVVSVIDDGTCALDISGGGFLYNMVRIIAGTLMNVGSGRCQVTEIPSILAACDRSRGGVTMPPEGLCLEWIRFRDEASEESP
jgi:tRNA pseudouridine38-40 synthase